MHLLANTDFLSVNTPLHNAALFLQDVNQLFSPYEAYNRNDFHTLLQSRAVDEPKNDPVTHTLPLFTF